MYQVATSLLAEWRALSESREGHHCSAQQCSPTLPGGGISDLLPQGGPMRHPCTQIRTIVRALV